jgi:hypothetical protein
MPLPVEDQPWYPQWRRAVERLIAAREAHDSTRERVRPNERQPRPKCGRRMALIG